MLSHSRLGRYDCLREFALEIPSIDPEALDAVLLYDLYLREKLKTRPAWAPETQDSRDRAGRIYADDHFRTVYLEDFCDDSVRQIRHETHLEFFSLDVLKTAETGKPVPGECCVLFNYRQRSPLDSSAKATVLLSF